MIRTSVSPSPSSTTRSAVCTRRSPTLRSCATKSPGAQAEIPSSGCDGRRGRSAAGYRGTRLRRTAAIGGAAWFTLPKSFALADGHPLGDEVALEHLVGGGAGKVGCGADVSWSRLERQVGLCVEKGFEFIGVEGGALVEDDRGHQLVADAFVWDGVHRDAVDGAVAQQDPFDWRRGQILAVDPHPVGGAAGEVDPAVGISVGEVSGPVHAVAHAI